MFNDQGVMLPDDHRERRSMHPSHVIIPGLEYPKYITVPSGTYRVENPGEEATLREKESEC